MYMIVFFALITMLPYQDITMKDVTDAWRESRQQAPVNYTITSSGNGIHEQATYYSAYSNSQLKVSRDKSESVTVVNERYCFRVERLEDERQYRLVEFHRLEDMLANEKLRQWYVPKRFPLEYRVGTCDLLDVLSTIDLQDIQLQVLENGNKQFVFDAICPGGLEITEGRITLSSDSGFRVLEFSGQTAEGEYKVTNQFELLGEQYRLVRRDDKLVHRDGQAESYSDSFEYEIEPANPTQYYLSGFGLPEPEFMAAKSYSQVLIWAVVIAVVLMLVGACIGKAGLGSNLANR
jgi:hypothetical protein